MSDFDVVVVGASVAGYDVWRKFEAIGSRRRSPVTLFAPRALAHVARAT